MIGISDLYDDEFLAKAIRGDYAYGTEAVGLHLGERILLFVLKLGMLPVYAVISLVAHIPVASALLEMFVTAYPRGAVGFFLRGAYYKNRLKRMGRNTLIDLGVSIWNPGNVEVGDNTHIDTYVKIEGGGPVVIGSYVHVASFVVLQGRGGVTVGDYVGIAAGSLVFSASNYYTDGRSERPFVMSACAPIEWQHVDAKPVVFEDHTFVGLNSVVAPGVTIRRGTIVWANSTVTHSLPPYSVAFGSPARVIKERRPVEGLPGTEQMRTGATEPGAADRENRVEAAPAAKQEG